MTDYVSEVGKRPGDPYRRYDLPLYEEDRIKNEGAPGIYTKPYNGWDNYKNAKSGNYNRVVCGKCDIRKDGPGYYPQKVVVLGANQIPPYQPHKCGNKPDPAIRCEEQTSCYGWLPTCANGPRKEGSKLASGNGYKL